MAKRSATDPLSIRQNILWNSVGSLLNSICQWLTTVAVVRIASGYDAAGTFSLAVAVYAIFYPVAHYRMYTYQISDVRKENTTGEYLTFRVVTNAIALLLCFGYAAVTCPSDVWLTILLYALYQTTGLMFDVLRAAMQRHHRMDYVGVALGLSGVLNLALFAGVFYLTRNLNLAIAAKIVATALVGLCYTLPRALRFGPVRFGITASKVRHLLLLCLPLVVAGIAASASGSVPRQYLHNTFGEQMLGIYTSVAMPVAIIPMTASYIYSPLISSFAELFANGDGRGFRKLLGKTFASIAAIGALCSVVLALLGAPLLELVFANDIGRYAYLLQPLILCAIVNAFMWFGNDLMIAVHDYRGAFATGVGALVVALVVMVPLIQTFDMNGVSFTGIIASGVSATIMAMRVLHSTAGMQNRGEKWR